MGRLRKRDDEVLTQSVKQVPFSFNPSGDNEHQGDWPFFCRESVMQVVERFS